MDQVIKKGGGLVQGIDHLVIECQYARFDVRPVGGVWVIVWEDRDAAGAPVIHAEHRLDLCEALALVREYAGRLVTAL